MLQKENRELIDTIERYTDGLIFTTQMKEIIQTLSAAKPRKKMEREIPMWIRLAPHAVAGCDADSIKGIIQLRLLLLKNKIEKK